MPRPFKSHASSGRAGGTLGGSTFGSSQSSSLSYIQEPIDFSHVEDANLVVALKNLSKKDGTTKAKALEDLQAFVGAEDALITDNLLEIWARVFPRLSVDSTRRVRQLVYDLNGQICSKSGKRTVRFMPALVGPWLAGTFDNDRAVARAASGSLTLVFSTPEKVHGVQRTFQNAILQLCRDAVLHETVSTLSDERSVSADDANATYARVVSSGIALLSSLLKDLSADERRKEHDLYEEVLSDPKLFELVNHSDASVRRSVHKLVREVLRQELDIFQRDSELISTSYVYKGLHTDQSGAALDFLLSLSELTRTVPEIWTTAYRGKKPALTRLRHFLKQGSQSSAVEYWAALIELIKGLPREILPTTADQATELLEALRTGVTKKEERFNAAVAWPAFFALADVIAPRLDSEASAALLHDQVLPCVKQYLLPGSDTEAWNIGGGKAASIAAQAVGIEGFAQVVQQEYPSFVTNVIQLARMSQPEQSKDFPKSQIQVAAAGERYADLQRELFRNKAVTPELRTCIEESSVMLLKEMLTVLTTRNGKPYGAAAVVEALLRQCARPMATAQNGSDQREFLGLLSFENFASIYMEFAEHEMPKYIFGPSQRHLIHGLYAAFPTASRAFAPLLHAVFTADQTTESKIEVLRVMYSPSAPSEVVEAAKSSAELQDFLKQNGGMEPNLVATMAGLDAIEPSTFDDVLISLLSRLTTSDNSDDALVALDSLTQTIPNVFGRLMSKTDGGGEQLLSTLLQLEQSDDDKTAEKASAVASRLSKAAGDVSPQTKYALVLQNLERVHATSLDIGAVLELLHRLIGPDKDLADVANLIPSLEIWKNALLDAMSAPKASLAILSPFGGAVHFVHSGLGRPAVKYDGQGLSQALRIALYVDTLQTEYSVLNKLGDEKNEVIALLQITQRLAQDALSLAAANGLWHPRSAEIVELPVLDFIGRRRETDHFSSTDPGEAAAIFEALQLDKNDMLSPATYYSMLCSAELRREMFERLGSGRKDGQDVEQTLRAQRSAGDLLPLLANLVGYQQPLAGSLILTRYCNELVADLTDLDLEAHLDVGMSKLVTLNTIIATQEDVITSIAKQRIIFLVKKLVSWLDLDFSSAIKAEICKLLTGVLPAMSDMYGQHWEQILSFLCRYWLALNRDVDNGLSVEERIVLEHSSLKLLAALSRLARADEPNDDLVDALKDKRTDIQNGLLNLLCIAEDEDDEAHQPLMVTQELLARQLSALPTVTVQDAGELYPLMYARSRAVQQAAFDVLHRHIPAAQEQVSLDAALENKTAQLPDELLSLILEAPTLDSLADESFDRNMPRTLQGYLFGWRLLFDHFSNSSFRVKNDYIEQLKDGTYLTDLLRFTFDFLGHSRGKPVDASKFDIPNYIADTEPSPERDVQWLLAHIYYLALSYMPTLVKSYFLDIRSRQTSLAVESWTSKYLSPLIISAALQEVAEWTGKTVKDEPEYENMTVKVGMKSKEINVSYAIDEQIMAMRVALPDAYPLANATVQGINRVAVKEEKWQSWLRNCQGVITFSNGSITDGLSAWRKNVTGALKGQSECAICYSIISADKQLPTKRCQTCKNLFHSSCLFKWFKTSNASSCPLCRTAFNFN